MEMLLRRVAESSAARALVRGQGRWRAVQGASHTSISVYIEETAPGKAFQAAAPAVQGSRWLHTTKSGFQAETAGDKAAAASEFNRTADGYLGDLWNRLERGLREAEGETFDFEVKPKAGGFRMELPDGGWMSVRKDPGHASMVVECNLFPPWQNKGYVEFKLEGNSGDFMEPEGEELEEFIQKGLCSHLKAKVNLGEAAPTAGEDGG